MDFKNRPLGVIPSKPDHRDYRLYEFTSIEKEFPDYYLAPPYTREEDIPVYDQNGFGMCVAFSGASIKEQQEYKETGRAIRMSPGFIYGNREEGMYLGEGMMPREAWKMLCKDGTPAFEDFPILGVFATCHTEVMRNKERLLKKARNNRALSYVAINFRDTSEVKTAITKCGFINLDIAVYNDFYDCPKSGYLSKTRGSINGYHALTVVGWKTYNGKTYWIVLNSWGKEWGKNGLCYMPADYAGIYEMWAITDMQRRVIEAGAPAQIVPPGHFVVPFRGLFEAENAESIDWWRNESGKIEAEAVLPAIGRRKVHVVEGSKDITVEMLE